MNSEDIVTWKEDERNNLHCDSGPADVIIMTSAGGSSITVILQMMLKIG